MAERLRIICDANVLIDMESAGLLEVLFRLDYRFATPDVLYVEELQARHPELPGLGLKILELLAEGVGYTVELNSRYARVPVGRNDLFALALGRQEGCPVLTGDRHLRMICDEEGVAVHGTLWLMDRLIEAGLVDHAGATAAYDRMREEGRRLPWDEVRAQLARFRR